MTHHKLIVGDCLEVMRGMPDESIDLILTDPPYGVTQNPNDQEVPLDLMWADFLNLRRNSTTPIIITSQQPFTTNVINSNRRLFRYDLIWHKGNRPTGFLNAGTMPLRNHEIILIFYDSTPTYHPQYTRGEPTHSRGRNKKSVNRNYGEFDFTNLSKNNVDKYPVSVIEFNRPHPSIHPTEKPVDLIKWLIKTYTNEGDTILDPFAGSFTTSVAARDTGRNSIGIEINPEYLAMGKRRLGVDTPPLDGSITYEVINMAREHLDAPDEPEEPEKKAKVFIEHKPK